MPNSTSAIQHPLFRRRYPAPTWWEYGGLILFLLVVIVFGGLVELRGAFLERRMTDVGVYLRAAWAVRVGQDIYQITDDNQWHYHYPPLLAILMVPLADPPAGASRAGMLPYAVSVAVWYGVGILCLFAATHVLARALEAAALDTVKHLPPPGCRRWWLLRMLPMMVCLPAIGGSLMRGQVNLLVLLLLCAMIAALLRGCSMQAGLWLAGAICLKVIPALLLFYPVWRRDLRCLAGCVLGLILGLVLIPILVFGPARTVSYYKEWNNVLLRPALAVGTDQSRAEELIKVTRTDSQSFLAILHNTRHADRQTRPHHASWRVRLAHWLIGGTLTLFTLLAAGRRGVLAGAAEAVFLGLLIVLMVLLSPVSHLHYFCLQLPLVMALLAAQWERAAPRWAAAGLPSLLTINVIANALTHIPGLDLLRDLGAALYAALGLWLAGFVLLRNRARQRRIAVLEQHPLTATAA